MRLKRKNPILSGLLALGMALSMICVGKAPEAYAEENQIPIRYPYGEEYSEPGEGYIYVESTGSFSEDTVQDILDQVNAIRYEACQEGLPTFSLSSTEPTGKYLTPADYKPVKWSETLQWMAQTRAAETSVMWSHDRPNKDPYEPKKEDMDIYSFFEVLAGSSTVADGIRLWYSEKDDYIESQGLFLNYTGHYGAMIDPNVEYIGMASFKRTATGVMSHTMYGHADTVSEKDISIHGQVTCLVEVAHDNVKSVSVREENKDVTEKKLVPGDSWQVDPYAKVSYSFFRIHSGISFSSSDTSVASVDASGKVTAKAAGTTTITVKINDTKKAEVALTVRAISKITAPSAITVASGTSPASMLPGKVEVTWSDGTKSEEAVTWGTVSDAYKNRAGGSFTVTGTLTDYSTKTVTQSVIVEPAYVTAVTAPSGVTTASGTPAVLPGKVTVTWSNGDTSAETVTWNSQPAASYGKTAGGSYTVSGTVQSKTTSVTVTVLPATISSVAAISTIETTEGIAPVLPQKVSVTWSNGDTTTKRDVTWNSVPATAYATPNTSFTVSGSISDFSGNVTGVTATVRVIPRVLQSLSWKEGSISGTKSYHRYSVDQVQGVLVASYNNGTEREIRLTADMISFDADCTETSQTAEVVYSEGNISRSLTLPLTLEVRTGITVIALPDKTTFLEGDDFDFSGLRFGYVYSDETVEEVVDIEKPLAVGGYDADTPGNQKINVIYDGFTTSYGIVVKRKSLSSIEVTKAPSRSTYVTDQPFEADGIEVTAQYNNGTAEVLKSSRLCISTDAEAKTAGQTSVDLSTAGEITVYVAYTDPFVETNTKRTSFTVRVEERVVTELTLTKEPEQTFFAQNDMDFDFFRTARVKAVYNDGLYEEELEVKPEMIRDFDLSQIGTQTVRIQLGEKSVTFEAEVTEPITYSYREEWVDGKWYDEEGHQLYLPTGAWKHNSKGYWYQDTSGWYPKNCWQKIDGVWYFFRKDGYMASAEWVSGYYWLNKNGSWTYKAKASWNKAKKGWWFGDTKGWYAKNEWQKIDGKWYYFAADGYLVTDQYVDGCYVGKDGAWVK